MHLNSQLLFGKYATSIFTKHMKVLEIGPDKSPSTYQSIVGNNSIVWETLDIFSPEMNAYSFAKKLTYVSENEYLFHIENESFDIVLSGQVIEHVKKPWIWIKELARICKMGGYVVTIGPISWPHHSAPIDCWRIYPEGMKALYEEANLTLLFSKVEALEIDFYENISHRPSFLKRFVSSIYMMLIKRLLVPGRSYKPGVKTTIKSVLRLPITFSLDTITIGIKEGKVR